jgi:hypothetical protein
MNALYYQHIAIFLNFAFALRSQKTFTCWNLTRLQRAAKGAGQSTRRRRNDVIQCRGVRLVDIGVHAIMLGHLRMNPKPDWLTLHGQVRATARPFHPFNADIRCINNVAHKNLLGVVTLLWRNFDLLSTTNQPL